MKNEDRQLLLMAKLKQMDFLGATLLVAAVSCLLLALQWGGATYPWRSSIVIGLCAIHGSKIDRSYRRDRSSDSHYLGYSNCSMGDIYGHQRHRPWPRYQPAIYSAASGPEVSPLFSRFQ